jgi:hypothetical protein
MSKRGSLTRLATQRKEASSHYSAPTIRRKSLLNRFRQEQPLLVPLGRQRRFALEARVQRVVAEEYLVSYETNLYSVPFSLIGQTVELERRGALVILWHRGQPVAQHPLDPGRHQVHLLAEHGPGATARTQRRLNPSRGHGGHCWTGPEEVEVRDLTLYEQLARLAEVAV